MTDPGPTDDVAPEPSADKDPVTLQATPQVDAADNSDQDPAPSSNTSSSSSSADEEFNPRNVVINNFLADIQASTIGYSVETSAMHKPAIRRDTGIVLRSDADHALRHYLRPAAFRQAAEVLADRHIVALCGLDGCGRRAGAKALVREVGPDAETFTALPPTKSLFDLADYKYRQDEICILNDWMPVSEAPKSRAQYDFERLVTKLREVNAYLVISFVDILNLRMTFDEVCVQWSAPDAVALLDRCLHELPDLAPSDEELASLRECAQQVKVPRLIVRLAEAAAKDIQAAVEEAQGAEGKQVAEWFAAEPPRWKVIAAAALVFLSGVGERDFEVLLTDLDGLSKPDRKVKADDEPPTVVDDDLPFKGGRWKLANETGLDPFITMRDPDAPVGAAHRPAFRTKAYRLRFMTELSRRYGDELWTPIGEWLFMIANREFGVAQIASGYGLALLARCALDEVECSYLIPWSSADLRHRLMAVNVLWAMAEDDEVAAAAFNIAVRWVHNKGQERAITAAIALGGPLGHRYPSEALRWLWVLAQRAERISLFARVAMGQLLAFEAESDVSKSAVVRFLVQTARRLLKQEAPASERQAVLSLIVSVLSTCQGRSATPVIANVLRTKPADLRRIGELWATALNVPRYRAGALFALQDTLIALAEGKPSVELAGQLGDVILPRLTPRADEVLRRVLPKPIRETRASARVIAAFLGSAS